MTNCITIIPARGGSKGLPGKNIRNLAGKPLIAHSILTAKSAQLVNHVYVTTDDPKIADISRNYGASVINRPLELATDEATSEVALLHALSILEMNDSSIDLVVFLQCTSPLRTSNDIDHAIKQLQNENSDSLLSVSPSHRFLWQRINGLAQSINYNYHERKRRQDMNPQYLENGSIYIFKPWILKEHSNRLGGKISLFVMSEIAAHEIDTLLDFEIAEFLLKQQVVSHVN